MIIECQSCHARFRLDETKIRGKGARVKCRRCGDSILVLKEGGQPGVSPEAGDRGLLDLGSAVRESLGGPGAPPPAGAGGRSPDNLIPFPVVPRPAERPPGEPRVPEPGLSLLPGAPAEKDEVDLAFERLLAGIDEAAAPGTPPSGFPLEAGETLAPPEPSTPIPETAPEREIPQESTPEFSPDEKLEFFPPAEEATASEETPGGPPPEEAAAPFQGSGGFLLGGSDTPDFLKGERGADEEEAKSDISLFLSKTPLDEGAPSLREPSPFETAGAAALPTAPPGGGEISIERNETPSAPAEEFDVPPLREEAPVSPRGGPPAHAPAPSPTRSTSSPALVAAAGLTALLVAGIGYFGFTSSGRKTIESVAPGAAVLWEGKPAEMTGPRYDMRNVIGYYERGAGGNRMLVIKGQVANLSGKEKSGIRVVASILDSAGKTLAEQTVYAGNVLSGDALRKATRESAARELGNRFGDGLTNMNVAPGKSIPFMVVFFDAPEDFDSYKLEARDSE